ncbi:Syntaxin-19 [Bagarius yarrelli]|uniref:Syntaxin-19 n=1 Tax=Bagarius yarrelli TaxID=175774 RepID=A0A556TXQ3_BAGYA|nr:Syntaxin-19 [Bagarius yarrelli]
MKDRLEELRLQIKANHQHQDDHSFIQNEEDGPMSFIGHWPQAVLFETEPVLENFLDEAKRVRDNLEDLEAEVKKFSQQQRNLVVTLRRFSVMKKERSLTRDIQLQAESLRKKLDALSKQAKLTENELGPSAATTRIQHAQHDALFLRFQKVMHQYNDSLLGKQDKCKQFIIRQLEIAGREVSDEEVENMVEQGKWDVFNENILVDVKITRTQLSEIEQRHKELITLESNMKDLRELFLDVFMLVEEQGVQIDNIQANVEKTQDYVMVCNEKFKMAVRYRKKNPLRRLCCCCCPWA